MANLSELIQYDSGVYQIETSDPVLGGPSGVSNLPLKNLANRTAWLKKHVDDIESGATVPTGIATRNWVTGELNKLSFKAPVRAATSANISLSGLQTIDGVALTAGDRVLVKSQSTGTQNGIYLAQTSAWIRSTDLDEDTEVRPGIAVVVTEGATQSETMWLLTNDGTVTVGGTALTFSNILGRAVQKDSDTGAAAVPAGTTAQRPANAPGLLRYNSSTSRFEGNSGSGWGSLGGATGGGTDAVFYLNDQGVNNDFAIPSGQNAMSAGPITIASGKTVTVPGGSVWTVV